MTNVNVLMFTLATTFVSQWHLNQAGSAVQKYILGTQIMLVLQLLAIHNTKHSSPSLFIPYISKTISDQVMSDNKMITCPRTTNNTFISLCQLFR